MEKLKLMKHVNWRQALFKSMWQPLSYAVIVASANYAMWVHESRNPDDIAVTLAALTSLTFLFSSVLDVRKEIHKQLGRKVRFHRLADTPQLNNIIGNQAALFKLGLGKAVPESILAAATRHPNGTIYATFMPGRHHDNHAMMDYEGQAGIANTQDQGFLTTSLRYVDRVEACVIARRNNQIVEKTGGEEELYSECVWP